MSTVAFQGFGNDREIGPETRLECKICWYVYDPAAGDLVVQVRPATPFTDLPPLGSCPKCADLHSHFMVIRDD